MVGEWLYGPVWIRIWPCGAICMPSLCVYDENLETMGFKAMNSEQGAVAFGGGGLKNKVVEVVLVGHHNLS